MKIKIKTTLKQKKFVQNKLKGMSSQKAAIEAGYSPVTAKNANREITEKRGVQAYLNKLGQLLEDNGTTDEVLARKITEGLEAKTPREDAPDYKTRLDYIKYSSDLKGHNVAQKIEHSGSVTLSNYKKEDLKNKKSDDLLKLSNDQLREEL